MNVGNLVSGSSASLKTSLYISEFLVHILLEPGLKDFEHNLASMWTSLVAQTIKHLSTMWEIWVQSLGREDPRGGGNGNPLQHSCLENPMDGGA